MQTGYVFQVFNENIALDHAAGSTYWSVLLEHYQCLAKPNRTVDACWWIKAGAHALLLYCIGYKRGTGTEDSLYPDVCNQLLSIITALKHFQTLLQKCCSQSKHSTPCSGRELINVRSTFGKWLRVCFSIVLLIPHSNEY